MNVLLPADLGTDWMIGHRGAARLYPENTLGGIRATAESGIRWVEMDVTWMKDGTAVINHDDSVDRCSDRGGKLLEMNWSELNGINNAALFADWPAEPVPRLDSMLDLLVELKMGLNLEIKGHGADLSPRIAEMVSLLRQHFSDPAQLIVSSFEMDAIRAMRDQAPEIRRGLLFDRLPDNWRELVTELKPFSFHLDWKSLNYADARAIREAGLNLYCWTANDPVACAGFWQWGVNGIISDDPAAMARAFGR